MNATSCLEIFSLLIFSAATLGIILQQKQKQHQLLMGDIFVFQNKVSMHSVTCSLYLMPRSLARLSWRSMMLCRISSTSCLSSLSSIREMEKSGSRKGGGRAAAMDLDLKPEVTWGKGEREREMGERGGRKVWAELPQCDAINPQGGSLRNTSPQSLKVTFTSSTKCPDVDLFSPTWLWSDDLLSVWTTGGIRWNLYLSLCCMNAKIHPTDNPPFILLSDKTTTLKQLFPRAADRSDWSSSAASSAWFHHHMMRCSLLLLHLKGYSGVSETVLDSR